MVFAILLVHSVLAIGVMSYNVTDLLGFQDLEDCQKSCLVPIWGHDSVFGSNYKCSGDSECVCDKLVDNLGFLGHCVEHECGHENATLVNQDQVVLAAFCTTASQTSSFTIALAEVTPTIMGTSAVIAGATSGTGIVLNSVPSSIGISTPTDPATRSQSTPTSPNPDTAADSTPPPTSTTTAASVATAPQTKPPSSSLSNTSKAGLGIGLGLGIPLLLALLIALLLIRRKRTQAGPYGPVPVVSSEKGVEETRASYAPPQELHRIPSIASFWPEQHGAEISTRPDFEPPAYYAHSPSAEAPLRASPPPRLSVATPGAMVTPTTPHDQFGFEEHEPVSPVSPVSGMSSRPSSLRRSHERQA